MKLNPLTIAAILIAASPFAQAQSLNNYELQNVRAVLRSININESQLSNEDIEKLRSSGEQLRQLEDSRNQLSIGLGSGQLSLTCGTGTHGGGTDPVGNGF